YGWYEWKFGGRNRSELPIARVTRRLGAVSLAVGVLGWLGLWMITARLPGTALPMADSALAAASLVAPWLMTRKLVENWVIWIAVNIGYVPLYLYKGLCLTSALYAIYLGLAVMGWLEWRRQLILRPA